MGRGRGTRHRRLGGCLIVAYRGKNRSPLSITFNDVAERVLGAVTVGNTVAITVVQDYMVFAQQCRILKAYAVYSALTGAPAIQLVVGTGAPGTNGTADTAVVAGNTIFSGTDVALTAAADVGQFIAPAAMNAIIPAGTVLTLRVVTGGADSVTGLKVVLVVVYEDQYPQKPVIGEVLNPTDF